MNPMWNHWFGFLKCGRGKRAFKAFAAALLGSALLGVSTRAFSTEALFEMSFRADKSEMTLGDELTLSIEVLHGKSYKLLPLPRKPVGPPFEVKRIESIPPKAQRNAIREGYRVVLTAFELGQFKLAPFEVSFLDEEGRIGKVLTEEVTVTIQSIGRKETDRDDIRPIRGPYALARAWARAWPWLVGLLGVGILGLAIYCLRRFGSRTREDPESRLPPYERALRALERLEKKRYLETRQAKAFFTELSEIFERYWIDQHGIGSYEHTTEEFLEAIRSSPFGNQVLGLSEKVFQISDLAKFAKWIPPIEESVAALEDARRIVKETQPQEPEEVKKENP